MPVKIGSQESTRAGLTKKPVQQPVAGQPVPELAPPNLQQDARLVQADQGLLTPGQVLRLQRTVGNVKVGRLLDNARARGIVQREDDDAQEPEIAITEAEAQEDIANPGMPSEEDIRSRMAADFGVDESSQNILYMNVPEMISGMGWSQNLRDQLTPIFRRISDGRDRLVMAAYQAWQENTGDPALEAAFQAAMTRFEAEVGTQARRDLRDIWLARADSTADPAAATSLAGEAGRLRTVLVTLRDGIFPTPPEGAEASLPTTLAISDVPAKRTQLNELFETMGGISRRIRAMRLALIERALQNQINRAGNAVQPKIRAVLSALRARLNAAQVGRLANAFTQALDTLDALITQLNALPARMGPQQAGALAAHPQQAVMANRLLDPDEVPILLPSERQRQVVTRGGRRFTFETHQEVTFTAYESAFNMIGEGGRRPAPRPLPAASTGGSAPAADMPMPSRRALQAYQSLLREGAPVSEAKIVAAISSGEGNFAATQAIDRVRFSWGFIQFQGQSLMGLLREIHDRYPGIFAEYFESYGITLAQRGVTPSPVERNTREMAGVAGGVTSGEALGVGGLLVYDHNTQQWVSGNEGLNVIQRDPRYQVLFRLAAEHPEVEGIQIAAARSRYVGEARSMRVAIGRPPTQRTLVLRDFVQNEVVMFAIASRRVGGGLNDATLTAMFTAFATAQSIPIDDNLASALRSHQAEMATFVRGYGGMSVNWGRADNLAPAGIAPLSDTTYTE